MKPRQNIILMLGFVLVIAAMVFAGHVTEDGIGITLGGSKDVLVGFHGSRCVQRSGSAQAAVTLTTGAALATTAVTQTTPYGFATQAQGDLLTTRINTLIADNIALNALVTELRAALVEKGIIKGS